MYRIPDPSTWKGRVDIPADAESRRWHQVIRLLDITGEVGDAEKERQSFSLLGFCCDEGVRRNQGRVGAKEGPAAIRSQLRNLAVHFDQETVALFDAGDVLCAEQKMEAAQEMLSKKVHALLKAGYKPLLLGGGHEIAFGHFRGIHRWSEQNNLKTGIINLDAHFDLRSYSQEGNSGTPFRQAFEYVLEKGERFHYLVLGIQDSSNTQALFNAAKDFHVQWEGYSAFRADHLGGVYSRIESFVETVDAVYLTLDLDVLNQAFAPGVSAPAPFGLMPETVRLVLQKILRTGKVVSVDIAELNPLVDRDHQTARLAAWYVQEIVREWGSSAAQSRRAVDS